MDSRSGAETILGGAPLIRRLPSWIESFYELTADLPSPQIFKKWAAISTLAGAMERRVWTYFRSWNLTLYPHMYVLLVGPAGVGKTIASVRTERFWRAVKEFHVAPRSVSKASLMDSLNDAKRTLMIKGELIQYNSLLVIANEFGSFLPSYDNEFLAALTDIYDGEIYEERKRTRELKFKIEAPQLNLLACTTPSYLTSLMPEGAWEQGFTSRTILVFSGEKTFSDPFGEESSDFSEANTDLFRDMAHDLQVISTAYGKMKWDREAEIAYRNWYLPPEMGGMGREPVPTHPRLTHYLSRRETHLAKLMMVASISRDNSLLITLEDFQTALGWLVEAEFYMPDLFKSMIIGADARAIEETFHYVFTHWTKTKRPLPEHLIVHQLMSKVPSHSVMRVLENMVRSNMIEETGRDSQNRPLYKPISQLLHQGG